MREELANIMINLIKKGHSLEQVKASFINAGYDKRGVEEAAEILGSVQYQFSKSQLPTQLSQLQSPIIIPKQTLLQRQIQLQTKPKRKTLKIIIILLIILIFLTAIGFLGYYWESVQEIFTG